MKNDFLSLLLSIIFFFYYGNSNSYAQKGVTYWRHLNDTNFLCGETIYCYNDSIAFWDAGCENHGHTVSIFKYQIKGDTIDFQTIKNGFNMLLRKVVKRKGDSKHPKFTIIGLNGYKETPYLLHVLPKRKYWLVRGELELEITENDSITLRDIKSLKKGPVIPDNLFPLLFDELKTHYGSLYHDITAYIYLPNFCLSPSENKQWADFNISILNQTDSTALEIGTQFKWHKDYYNNYQIKENVYYKKKE